MDDRQSSSTSSPFLKLPLELREQIYNFHISSIPYNDRKSQQEPPLTQVSRAVRRESLPIYFSHCTLPIQIFIRHSYYGEVWLPTQPWQHHFSPSKLKYIRHFELTFALHDRCSSARVPIRFLIALKQGDSSRLYSIRHSFARSWLKNLHRIGDPADLEELIVVLRQHLGSVLDSLVINPGIGNFTTEHIVRLTKVDPDTLPV